MYIKLNYFLINIIWLIFDKEKKEKENHYIYDKCAHRYMWMDREREREMGWAIEKLSNFTRKIVHHIFIFGRLHIYTPH
jgi:hypothetical protein